MTRLVAANPDISTKENPGQNSNVAGYRLLNTTDPSSAINVSRKEEHANIAPVKWTRC